MLFFYYLVVSGQMPDIEEKR